MKIPIPAVLRRNADFAGNIATLLSGNGMALVIGLVATPFIARIFLPAHYGVVSLLLAVAQPLVVLGTLQLGVALVLPQRREDARALLGVAATWLAWISLALLFGGLALRAVGVPLPFTNRLGAWIWCLPVAVALLGLVRLGVGWLMREKSFGAIARGEVTTVTVGAGTRLGTGLAFGSSVAALIFGYFAGLLAQLFVLRRALPDDVVKPRGLASAAQVKQRVTEFRDFPLYNVPANFLANVAQALPIIMLGALFSAATAGLYAMAIRLVGAPGNIMTSAVRRVFLQKAARIHDRRKSLLGPLFKTTATLALLGVLPLGALWFFGEEFFTLLLGERWNTAGRYAEILAPLLYAQWLAAPSHAVLVVLRWQGVRLAARVVDVTANAAVFGWAYRQGYTAEWALAAFVVVRVLISVAVTAVTWALVPRATAR